ncbi:MAG: bifunctional riboflavin kinase/FAD synthetase [Actinomycetota bacterium]|jgi:riboflavin kinase/FMN adenylyltransferase
MRTVVGLERLSPAEDGLAVAIGTFDGVHVGHRALISKAREGAAELGCASGVITWDRHPAVTLRPDRIPPLLSSEERKTELLEQQEIDELVVLPFDESFTHISAEDFVTRVLYKGLGVKLVVVGDGWRFGHKAAGTVALLREMGTDLNFSVEEVPLREVLGEPVSSRRTRAAVQAGDIALARTLLGRAFDLDAVVRRGDDRGRSLGFPTANMDADPRLARPPRGIYAGRARALDLWYTAAISVGVNPTFGGDPETSPIHVEAYLLDFDSDLYGVTLRVEFWQRLRDELAFDRVDDLVAQMERDVEQTRSLVEET